MEEKKEIVTTRIYTMEDIKQLLGEEKERVIISINIPQREGPPMWTTFLGKDENLIKVEIREPYTEKK